VGLRPGETAADIGFGGGLGLDLLLRRVGDTGLVHGVELSGVMLDRARSRFAPQIQNGTLRLELGSLTALPLDDKSVDAAITVNTIYFVPDLDTACTELARVLRHCGISGSRSRSSIDSTTSSRSHIMYW
jgi:arsenite methyltransferase